jgi:hypothetical protein
MFNITLPLQRNYCNSMVFIEYISDNACTVTLMTSITRFIRFTKETNLLKKGHEIRSHIALSFLISLWICGSAVILSGPNEYGSTVEISVIGIALY